MGLFGFGKKKEQEAKEKADREHAEARRRMEESVQRRRQETAAAGGAPASTTAAAPGATGAGGEYTVQSGDSLSKIAKQKLGDANKWRQIYDANRAVIGDNPDLIKPGQRLRIPG